MIWSLQQRNLVCRLQIWFNKITKNRKRTWRKEKSPSVITFIQTETGLIEFERLQLWPGLQNLINKQNVVLWSHFIFSFLAWCHIRFVSGFRFCSAASCVMSECPDVFLQDFWTFQNHRGSITGRTIGGRLHQTLHSVRTCSWTQTGFLTSPLKFSV